MRFYNLALGGVAHPDCVQAQLSRTLLSTVPAARVEHFLLEGSAVDPTKPFPQLLPRVALCILWVLCNERDV